MLLIGISGLSDHTNSPTLELGEVYEWNAESKTLHFITHASAPIMAFAGLWDRWKNPAGEIIVSCSIITTEASRVVAPIHHRMPVILDSTAILHWLNQDTPKTALAGLLQPTEAVRIA